MADNQNELDLKVNTDISDSVKQFNKLQSQVSSSMKNISKITNNLNVGDGLKNWAKAFGKSVEDKTLLLTNFQREYDKLRNKLAQAIVTKDVGSIANISEDLKDLKRNYDEVSRSLQRNRDIQAKQIQAQREAQAALEDFERSLDPSKQKLYELEQKLKAAEEEFIRLKMAGQDTSSAEKNIRRLQKAIKGFGDSTKKSSSWFSKLLGRIRNISIYRAIRSGIKWITSGVSEGVKAFRQYDDGANESLANIQASLNQVRSTLAVSFVSVLESLEPVITAISDALTNMLNAFNYAMAKMQGKDNYKKAIKNNEELAESAEDTNKALADFDKFRTLGDTSQDDMFETVALIDEEQSKLSQFFEHFIEVIQSVGSTIKDVFVDLFESGIFDILLDAFNGVVKVLGTIIKGVAQFIKALSKAGLITPILVSIAAAFALIKAQAIASAIASAWSFAMAHPIIAAGVLAATIAGVSALLSQFSSGGTAISNIQSGSGFVGLADGGFTTANFIATNENGRREWVGRQAGTTAVVNDTEMTDLMYQAVKDGCYEGVLDALSDADSVSGSTSSSASVEIQGETIFTIVRDVARQKGLKFSKV